jgi:hypothetical protein
MKHIEWEWQPNSLTERLLEEMQYDDAAQYFVCGNGDTIKRAVGAGNMYCDQQSEPAIRITVWQDGPLTEEDKQAILAEIDSELLEDDELNPPRIIGAPEEEAKIPKWVHGIEAILGHPLPAQSD